MNIKTTKEIHNKTLEAWKHLASEYYKTYREESSDEIRLEMLRSIFNHVISKTVQRCKRKVKMVKKVQSENLNEMFSQIDV